jgi:hypothetical protein
METSKKTARIAGVFYLIVALAGLFSLMYVPSQLVVENDALATVSNIKDSPLLYRTGIVSGLICQTSFIFLVLWLYKLLRHVNATASLAMLVFVVTSVPISFVNSLNEYAALVLLSNDSSLQGFTQGQLYAQIMIFRDLYYTGIQVVGIFWGLWLFPLGYLVYKSEMFPKLLGIMLMAGCFGYIIGFFVFNFLPGLSEIAVPGNILSALAEFSFLFYLLIKGVKQKTDVITMPSHIQHTITRPA